MGDPAVIMFGLAVLASSGILVFAVLVGAWSLANRINRSPRPAPARPGVPARGCRCTTGPVPVCMWTLIHRCETCDAPVLGAYAMSSDSLRAYNVEWERTGQIAYAGSRYRPCGHSSGNRMLPDGGIRGYGFARFGTCGETRWWR